MSVRAAVRIASAACAVLIVGCSPPGSEPPARHVVLVSLDALGAAHVGAYGHAADTTPQLDALAAQMIRSHPRSRRVERLESVLAEIAGHEHVSPRPRHASVWLPLPTSDLATARRLVRYDFAAPFAEGRRVLDLGCGEGEGAVRLAEAGAAEVLAVDPSTAAIERARRLRGRERLRFAAMRLDATDVRDGAVELVVALGDLADERTRRDAIDEAARVLAPHGTLLIALQNPALSATRETRGIEHEHRGIDGLRRHLEYAFGNVSFFAERIETGGVSFRGRTFDPSRDAGWLAMATRPRRLPVDTDRAEHADHTARRNAA